MSNLDDLEAEFGKVNLNRGWDECLTTTVHWLRDTLVERPDGDVSLCYWIRCRPLWERYQKTFKGKELLSPGEFILAVTVAYPKAYFRQDLGYSCFDNVQFLKTAG